MKKETKIQIERAIKACEGMDDVRTHLVRALREFDRKETKSEAKNGETPWQKWKLDLFTGSMVAMNRPQAENALQKIERMISDEKGRMRNSDGDELITD